MNLLLPNGTLSSRIPVGMECVYLRLTERYTPEPRDKKLEDWLDLMESSDMTHSSRRLHEKRVVESDVRMWQCSWCSNSSALLKKCAQCGVVRLDVLSSALRIFDKIPYRYCDSSCQRAHWTDGHKGMCKKLAKSPA